MIALVLRMPHQGSLYCSLSHHPLLFLNRKTESVSMLKKMDHFCVQARVQRGTVHKGPRTTRKLQLSDWLAPGAKFCPTQGVGISHGLLVFLDIDHDMVFQVRNHSSFRSILLFKSERLSRSFRSAHGRRLGLQGRCN